MNYQEQYNNSLENPSEFWEEQAKEISWFTFPKEIQSLDEEGLTRWYKGGKLNTSYLALDYHVKNGRGNQTAIIYDSPVTQQIKKYSYSELLIEVEKVAGMLVFLGVTKGDRVIIYMPMIPETAFAMLACARIGAIHSVVFGGFSSHELAIRIDDATPKIILTASAGIEITKVIPYKPLVDEGIEAATHKVNNVVVLQRDFLKSEMNIGRDIDWMELRAKSEPATYVELDATDALYILYTSGTTGKPKGVMRDNGGHAVSMKYSMDKVYGTKPGDVFWSASDMGWVVGHSYIVYGPLIQGCTTIIFEGKPIKTPDAGTFWRVIEQHKVNIFLTAPTAFRAIKKEDPEGKLKSNYDTSSLKYQFVAGERCDANTLNWLENLLQIPVIDHWWQTESGWPMIANMAGIGLIPVKPSSVGKEVCGFEIKIVNEKGKEVKANEEGYVVAKYPLPPGCLPTLWNDTKKFKESYLDKFQGYYFTGDGGFKDEDGYLYITGRIDDVINVAGHRLSTGEMEEVLNSHPAVAECAVVGIADELKGQIPVGFVVLKQGVETSETDIEKELIQMIAKKIGSVASFKRSIVVVRLPKTRSGKILRKIIRAIVDGTSFNPPSTIEDITVLDELGLKIGRLKMNTAYLILGGNKGDKQKNLQQAIILLEKNVGAISKKSDIFITAAWGNTNQPDFFNQAICMETSLSAIDLLKKIISIEETLGRIRTHEKWMERTMDIDILFYNDDIIESPELKIPHPYIQERKFVLIPMEQLSPMLIHPKIKKNIKTLLEECTDDLEVKYY